MLHDIIGSRYVSSALLGGGGMAQVLLAHDRILDRDVALKVLKEQHAEDREFVERFRREATSVATLNHPNVVQVYDQGRSEDGRYYIAMEYVPGGTLKDRIDSEGALEPGEAARLASQIAEALQAAHRRGIIHRDIKPQNVLLTTAGDVKVADFGIARATSATAISRTSFVLGTVKYMSPEQAMGEPVGPASDLYSLGVVLYEMLTATVPFEAESPIAIAMKHITGSPQPLRELNPLVPEEMDAMVMELLAKKPENRYGSAAELAEDLRRARKELPLAFLGTAERAEADPTPVVLSAPVSGRTAGVPSGSLRRKLRRATVAALTALLALLGVLGWELLWAPEGVGTVQAMEGGPLGAPAAVSSDRDGSSRVRSGGAPAASASAVSASAVSASAVSASATVPARTPASASPVRGNLPTLRGQDGGPGAPGSGGSAAEEQYE